MRNKEFDDGEKKKKNTHFLYTMQLNMSHDSFWQTQTPPKKEVQK